MTTLLEILEAKLKDYCREIDRRMIEAEGLRGKLRVAEEALEFYGDEEARWIKREEFATGCELASRYNEQTGESECVPLEPGKSLGFRYVPRASLQADHGKRARQALEEIRK